MLTREEVEKRLKLFEGTKHDRQPLPPGELEAEYLDDINSAVAHWVRLNDSDIDAVHKLITMFDLGRCREVMNIYASCMARCIEIEAEPTYTDVAFATVSGAARLILSSWLEGCVAKTYGDFYPEYQYVIYMLELAKNAFLADYHHRQNASALNTLASMALINWLACIVAIGDAAFLNTLLPPFAVQVMVVVGMFTLVASVIFGVASLLILCTKRKWRRRLAAAYKILRECGADSHSSNAKH